MRKSFKAAAALLVLAYGVSSAFAAADPRDEVSPAQIATQSVRGGEFTKNYELTGENLVALIENMVDFTNPQTSIVFNRWTGQVFVKNTPAAQEQVNQIIGQIRQAGHQQVEIETRIMTVSGTDFSQKGLDFLGVDYLMNFNHDAAQVGTDTDPNDGAYDTGIDFQNLQDGTGGNRGGQLSVFALHRKFNVSAFIDFLEENSEANTLSAPRLTVFNNQRAHIKISQADFFVRELLITSDADATTVATEMEVAKADSGTVLDVTPTINRDGTITLELHPQFVTVDLTNTQTINVAGGGLIAAASQPFVSLPVFNNQSIDTTATIEDGGVIMLGGLIDEREEKIWQRVPGIWKVPLFGKIFQNKSVSRTKTHLLIFIRARAVRPTALWSAY